MINWCRIDARITTSGQPTAEQLGAIADLGVRHVINLGLHSHELALPDEASDVARLGMVYAHIPVDFAAPREADFAAFQAALHRTEPDAVHVHCIFNWRVSAFFYRYRRDVLGMAEPAARADMDAIWQPSAVWTAFIAPR